MRLISTSELEQLLVSNGFEKLLPGEFYYRYPSGDVLVSRMYTIVPGVKRPGPSAPQITGETVVAMTPYSMSWLRKMVRTGRLHLAVGSDVDGDGKARPRYLFDTIEVMAFLYERAILDDAA